MKKNHLRWAPVYVLLVALILLALREFSLQPDGRLHIHVLDIGQGDSILIVSPSGKQIVIDGGPNMDLLSHLNDRLPFFDRTIELLVLTHPDSDHITAFPELLKRYKVDLVAMTGVQHKSGTYDAFLALMEKYQMPIIFSDASQDINIGDGLIFDIIWPPPEVFGTLPKNANNPSFVVRALYKDQSILLTGDIEQEAEEGILASGAGIRSNILKVCHHGSQSSSSTGFLLAVDPEIALISAGRDNKFGHPHQEVIDRFHRLGIPTRITADEGTIDVNFL